LVADDGNRTLANVTRLADKCLYAAKKAGRDCCFVANDVDEPVPVAA
jgi:GGDEF domain-containing protein